MRLTVFNGSPRAAKSNTRKIIGQFLEGYASASDSNSFETFNLVSEQQRSVAVDQFSNAEIVLIAFPLYVDSLPANLKAFIEKLNSLCGRSDNPKIMFMIHSGFPESIHSRTVARYLEKLADRLGCHHLCTIVRGFSERMEMLPTWATSSDMRKYRKLGNTFGKDYTLTRRQLEKFSIVEKYGGFQILIQKVFVVFLDPLWNSWAKRNKALKQIRAKPLVK